MAASALSAEIVPAGAGAYSDRDVQGEAVCPTPEQSIARLQRAAALVAADAEKLLADEFYMTPSSELAAAPNGQSPAKALDASPQKTPVISAKAEMDASLEGDALPGQASPAVFSSRYPAAIKSNGWRATAFGAIALCALLAGALLGVQLEPHISASKSVVDISVDDSETLQERVGALMREIEVLRTAQRNGQSVKTSAETDIPTSPAPDIQEMAKALQAQARRIDRLERLLADPLITNHSPPAQGAGSEDGAREKLRSDPAIPENGFILRGVHSGRATIQTRRGMIDVGPGDRIEGIGRISRIEKIDGRWVVLTNNGMIDGRE